jgi:hypothetical protein
MRHPAKTVLLILAALALPAAPPAMAEPAPAAEAGQPECPWAERGHGLEKKLDALHEALKLAPAQEAAWAEWSGKAKAARQDWKERRKDFEAQAERPAIERMEKRLALLKERLAQWEALLGATKAFYAGLSAEQQKTFDQQWKMGFHGRH